MFNATLLARPRALTSFPTNAFALLAWLGFVSLGAREVARYDGERLASFFVLTAVATSLAAWIAVRRCAKWALVQSYLCVALISGAAAAWVRFEHQGCRAGVLLARPLGVAGIVLGTRAAHDALSLRTIGSPCS